MSADSAAFADLVYRVLVTEKRGSLKAVAHDLGLKYPSLYARLRGRVAFRPGEIRALLRSVPDVRFVNFLLDRTPFVAVPRAQATRPPDTETMLDEGIQALEAAVMLVRSLEHSYHDDVLDATETQEVRAHLLDAERVLATLRTRLARDVKASASGRRPRGRSQTRLPALQRARTAG